ncbi:hypothetical protein [Bacillus sp. FJAT-44742]|uniref:hypothetical protein n=1 Tax=Bacillus sp. FJAT-44742 TaxID=2014005 RepID=UPI000C24B2CD|nr:hypothetical protein [Bacillus sp. FJAT-44742]
MKNNNLLNDIMQLVHSLEDTDHSVTKRVEERKIGEGKDASTIKTEYTFQAKAGLPNEEEIKKIINDSSRTKRLK